MMVAKKQTRGRQIIEIKRLTNEKARDVCFSKRRAGVFKKAYELSILSGSEVSIVVFSPGGKAFSFGHPSVDSVVSRLLPGNNESLSFAGNSNGNRDSRSIVSTREVIVEDLSRMWKKVQALTEAAKKRRDDLKKELKEKQEMDPFWWNADIWDMGLEEMMEFERMLKGLKCKIAEQRRTEQLLTEPYIQKPFSDVVGNAFGNVDGGGVAAANAPFPVENDDNGDNDVQLAPLPYSFCSLDFD